MIVSESRFELPGLPGVWIYPDDRTSSDFYAIPAHPLVATDSQGKPEISLLLYGSRKGSDFEAKGGIFTATVCLGLNSEQEKLAINLLTRRLVQASSTRPQLLSPDWEQGEVELELARDLRWREKPSLVGDNRCSFNVKLNAEQTKTLSEAWRKGLPNGSITYHVLLRSSSGSTSTSKSEFGSRSTTERGAGSVRQEHSSWERSTSSVPGPYLMDIRGPIDLPQAKLDSQLTTVGL